MQYYIIDQSTDQSMEQQETNLSINQSNISVNHTLSPRLHCRWRHGSTPGDPDPVGVATDELLIDRGSDVIEVG
jgi:hypothetical protein